MPNSVQKSIILLSFFIFAVSVALSFHWRFPPRVDAGAYDAIGWHLARGLGYVEHEENAGMPKNDDAIVRVGPGYQFFLAGVYRVAGHQVPVVWVLQAFLHALSTFFVFKLALLLFPHLPRGAHFMAALLFGLSPDLVFMNTMLLTESLFLFLFITAVYTTFLLMSDTKCLTRALLGAGFLWALAVLTRPVALLPFLVVLGIFLWRKEWKRAVMFLLPALLLVGSWSVFMSTRYNAFILTTTAGGYDLWVGNNPDAIGGFAKTPDIQAFRDTHHSREAAAVGVRKYFEFLANSPAAFLELQIRKASLYFSLIRPTGLWLDLQFFPIDRLILLGSSLLWTFVLFLGGLGGAVLLTRQMPNVFFARLFLLFAVLQPLAVIPIIVETRYRYALFPFLAILAAYLFGEWMQRRERTWVWNILRWPAVMLFVLTFYDVSKNAGDIIAKVTEILSL